MTHPQPPPSQGVRAGTFTVPGIDTRMGDADLAERCRFFHRAPLAADAGETGETDGEKAPRERRANERKRQTRSPGQRLR
jgi:hypothetical protein